MKLKPKFVIVMGGIATGKSTYRRKKYPTETSIDAGDIFIKLSKGGYYDFPSHLEDEMNNVGLSMTSKAITEKKDIVVELVGLDKELIDEVITKFKIKGYETILENIDCSIEEAKKRNNNRGEDNISAYYTESYHLFWLSEAIKS